MGLLNTLSKNVDRAQYAAQQTLRSAWYAGHYAVARRQTSGFDRPGEPSFRPTSGTPDLKAMRKAFIDLFAQDRMNIEAGLYPKPRDVTFDRLASTLRHSRQFLKDVPDVDARRLERRGTEVRDVEGAERYPVYYRQNFHYQSGGWLTDESADIYDTQVEVLFTGAASAMRRAALAQIACELKGKRQDDMRLLDVACGTGGFLSQTMDAFPRLKATGLDLSPTYTARARSSVRSFPQVEIIEGKAEAMPVETASQDIVVSIYLFHELPPKIRPQVVAEIERVLKPGGRFVFADSLQFGDNPPLDPLLEYFPHGFHEPYYASYLKEDFGNLMEARGLSLERTELAFLTKVTGWRKSA